MRNTTMQEKLARAFTSDDAGNRSNDEILSAVSAMTRKIKKQSKQPLFSPRYVTPPNRLNPFSVHAHPVSAFLTVDEEKRTEIPSPKSGAEPAKPFIAIASPDEPATNESSQSKTASPLPGDVELPKIAVIPSPNPPTDRSFPQVQTAFSPELSGMVGKLRMAKTAIAFTLEQLRARRKKTDEELAAKQRDLEGIDRQIEHEKENLRKIDETIEASALFAEQAASIDPGLLTFKGAHRKSAHANEGDGKRYTNRWSDDGSLLHIAHARKFFEEHPEVPPNEDGWSVAAIAEQMPAIKQAHAKISLGAMLAQMVTTGELERVGRGLYKSREQGSGNRE